MGKQLWEHTKNGFRHRWPSSEILFQVFWGGFFASTAVIVALRLAGIKEGIAITYWWVFVALFGVSALLTRLRIRMDPKNTELDRHTANKLIEAIRRLSQELESYKGMRTNEMDK